MQPIDDVRAISRIAYGFIASKALFAALDLTLFGHLQKGPGTLAALAVATGIVPQRLRTLLASLVSLGLLTRTGYIYANGPAAARYLVPGAPAYFGDYYRYQINRQLYPAMTHLDHGLAGNEAGLLFGGEESMMANPAQAETFSRAQHAGVNGGRNLGQRGGAKAGQW